MRYFLRLYFLFFILLFVGCKSSTNSKSSSDKKKLKVLILDGENNHGIWPKTTFMMKSYLEETGLFEVDINRKQFTWIGPHYNKTEEFSDINELLTIYPLNDGIQREPVKETKHDPDFSPDFNKYDLIVNNLGWKSSEWPEKTKKNFESYMKNGGGMILVHAANNAWGQWEEYNKMIGLGAWGDRDKKSGPYAFYNQKGEEERDPSEGICASHGAQYEFQLQTRAPEHPIMKGLPKLWLHAKDELYDRMRGPAENMVILATAYSDTVRNAPPWNKKVTGTGRHEPMLMAINYGKGRVFHSALGHMDYSIECVGFKTTFQRGAEWVATGRVTQTVPKNFPNKKQSSSIKWALNN